MASKRPLLSSIGARDVAHLLDAFQQMNSCILSLSMEVTLRNGRPDLSLTVNAYTLKPVTAERVLWASSRLSLSAQGYDSLEPAIIYALYQIDALLAAKEFSQAVPE